MRNKSISFIIIFTLCLLCVPAYNYFSEKNSFSKESSESFLNKAYNIDPILSLVGGVGNALGYSIDPRKVIVGKNGWLFLGNAFNNTVTKKISGNNDKYTLAIENVKLSVLSWKKYLQEIGCNNFYVIIGPDKDSIYSEFTPNWYKQSSNSISAGVIDSTPDVYIDTFAAIRKYKSASQLPLYFKTDTHWNELGASVAFNALAKKSSEAGSSLIWPTEKLVYKKKQRATGDLSNFQRSGIFLNDIDVRIISPSITKINITELSYFKKSLIYKGENIEIESPKEPLIIRSPQALNKKRVVWLRDSFGTAMSRIMAKTFYETLQIHHGKVKPSEIRKIIADYKPDYVIVTVVERDSMSTFFNYRPKN